MVDSKNFPGILPESPSALQNRNRLHCPPYLSPLPPSSYSFWPLPAAYVEAYSIATAPDKQILQTLAEGGIAIHLLDQAHSADYTELRTAKNAPCDAWLWNTRHGETPLPSEAYGIYTADCIPALLCLDLPQRRAGALIHLGRKGIESGLFTKCVGALIPTSSDVREPWPARLCLGPAIGACCYEVPTEMAQNFCERAGVSAECFHHSQRVGHRMLDLKRAVCEQAAKLAHIHWDIHIVSLCTACQAEKYRQSGQGLCYSYRQGNRTERIYTIVRFPK
ncbi:MAG: polyphenol oxidase family protein [Spirochaetota bacterium]